MTSIRSLIALLSMALLAGCASAPPMTLPEPLPPPSVEMPPRQINGAIYQAGLDVRLYEDRIARRVGDLVTVVFEEQTQASKDARTETSKENSVGLAAPIFGGRPVSIGGNPFSAELQGTREFQGNGSADQRNALKGVLTAQVISVQPNGNMVIQGRKKLTLNQGDEYVVITGIIRRDDVRADNTISSTRVADAQIAYTGTGALADANSMGWLTRFFHSVIFPF